MELYHKGSCESYKCFVQIINNKLDYYAPIKTIRLHVDEKFRELWLSVRIKKFSQKCCKLCKRAKVSGNKSDHDYYKKYRNTLIKIKNYEKKRHYQDLFQKIGKNSKLLWNVIHSLLKKMCHKSEITELLYNDQIISEQSKICNAFNYHFASAGVRVQSSINNTKAMDPLKHVKHVNENFTLLKITESKLCKLVKKLKPKTSSGLDDISNIFLQKAINVVKEPLCRIFNMSIDEGIFPEIKKIAKLTPLLKGGETYVLDNFCPISLLPVYIESFRMFCLQ